jgi:drug/metabolite transporter (DMT)-like permease
MELRLKLGVAFLAVYVIWGSTYLAIRFVIETIPPFFMAGTRFIIAGLILYALTRLRGTPPPTSLHWRDAFVIGGLLLLGGNGAVVWSEQWVPSGLTSLLIGTTPLWMVLVDSLHHRTRPSIGGTFGLLLGLAGVALLVGSIENIGENNMIIPAAIIIVFGAFLWATGSLYSRSARTTTSQLQPAALQMIAGGILLLSASLITGEWTRVILDQVSLRSMLSWLYLIIFGSLIAFSSYIWLLKRTTPSRVSTHAYINPLVAMILGWALAEEALTARNVLAAIIILISVAVITTYAAESEHT